MDTQSQDTSRMNRIEAARQAARHAALGTLSRARETLQVAATTVPAWARGVETRAGEQVDALLERVGLVRIAKVEAQRPVAVAEAAPAAPVAVEAAAPVEAADEPVEAQPEAPAETTATSAAASTEVDIASPSANDRSSRRKRR
jgi:hypothetical protein